MSAVVTTCNHSVDLSEFDAVTMSRTGSFELDMDPDDVLPLFTAPGEELWAPGWKPFILNGDGYEEGTVWVTMGRDHTTYWYVANYETNDRYARYVRVTPGANTGHVEVRVMPDEDSGTKVIVTYQLTGLSEAGNKNVEEMLAQPAYAEMMEHWRTAINENRDKIDAQLV